MYGPQQEQQPSPPLPQPQRDPVPLPQQQNTSSKITISQMQEQLLLSKHMRFTSLVSCMGYSMPEMAPAYLVRVCPAEKIEKGTDHMSDYQNSDTAKWDAQEVRKQASAQGPKPKKNRRLGWLGYLAGVIVASFLLAGIGWLAVNDVCALNKAPLTATIEVESGDSVGTVATKLKKAGLINSKLLFMITSPVFHASRYIQPGVYELNTDMDFNCLIKSMQPTGGVAATVTVTIPEGYTVEQIIQLLAENDVSDAAALEESAKNHVFDKFDFVDNENLGSISRLEGYLFPDTYEFYVKENADSALSRLLANFQDRIVDDPDLAPLIANSSYSLKEIVIMASLIEKETDGTDRTLISSVIHNRLENVGETAHLLQIDASLVYAAGREITEDDYQTLDSPYNLYTHQGLPPRPSPTPVRPPSRPPCSRTIPTTISMCSIPIPSGMCSAAPCLSTTPICGSSDDGGAKKTGAAGSGRGLGKAADGRAVRGGRRVSGGDVLRHAVLCGKFQ